VLAEVLGPGPEPVGLRGRRDQRLEGLDVAFCGVHSSVCSVQRFQQDRQEQPRDQLEAGGLVQRRGGLLQSVQLGLRLPRVDLDRREPRVLAEVLGP